MYNLRVFDSNENFQELHIMLLKTQQDLIIAKIGKEAAEDKIHSLQSDIALLKAQIANDQHVKESLENSLVAEINTLRYVCKSGKVINKNIKLQINKLMITINIKVD